MQGDWKGGGAEERRLLYVAMTRAKETLSLFQSRDNPFLCALGDSEAVRTVEPKVLPLPSTALDRIHRELTPRDVDLGYAGRRAAQHPVHAGIARLRSETHSISSSAIFGTEPAAWSGGWRRAMPAGSYPRRGESERHRRPKAAGAGTSNAGAAQGRGVGNRALRSSRSSKPLRARPGSPAPG
jgi:hypothetical protein